MYGVMPHLAYNVRGIAVAHASAVGTLKSLTGNV
jgi:hypothetical protein